jgi:cytochrome c oxidase subunit 2
MIGLLLLQLSGNQSALNPHGPLAGILAEMSWILIIGVGLIQGAVLLLLALALIRARHRRFLSPRQSSNLILYAGVAIPSLILVTYLIYSVSIGRRLDPKAMTSRGARLIHVNGKQWWWDIAYKDGSDIIARTANEIHIPVREPVVLELETSDVIHSFWVPNLAGKLDLIPARTNHMWLQADKPGIYRGQCAEYCGRQHAHMGLEVIAEAPEQFSRWLASQRQTAIEPSTDQQRRGREVFMTKPCALCHAVRGTTALAQMGPDLTHIGSRRTLAAATLPNNRGSLGGWISNAQGIKPGNHMPRITLSPGDLTDLIAYLETLK